MEFSVGFDEEFARKCLRYSVIWRQFSSGKNELLSALKRLRIREEEPGHLGSIPYMRRAPFVLNATHPGNSFSLGDVDLFASPSDLHEIAASGGLSTGGRNPHNRWKQSVEIVKVTGSIITTIKYCARA